MALESGVCSYTHYYAVVEVHFPVDEKGHAYERCSYCRYYGTNNKCKLTDEIIYQAERWVGNYCPLVPKENEDDISETDSGSDRA